LGRSATKKNYIKLASIYVYEYLLTSVTVDYCRLLSVVIDYFCGTHSHKKVNYWLLSTVNAGALGGAVG
jgi:hypothetical protein